MPDYSQNLNLFLPFHGEYPDTWETPANANFSLIDTLFDSARSDTGGGGHIHDGSPGQGPKLDHTDLLTIGTYTHAQLDTHVDDDTVHFLVSDISLTVSDDDYAGTGATVSYPDAAWNNGPNGEDVIRELRFPNAVSITSPSAGVIVIDTAMPGSGGPAGVPNHLPSTYSPVAVTDYFLNPNGTMLSQSNWWVTSPQMVEYQTFNGAAVLSQDVAAGGVASGTVINRVSCQVPHSEVQRVTLDLCRLTTDDLVANSDSITFQIALMSSVFQGQNTISRLGFFLVLNVFKQSSTVMLTKSIIAVPSVNSAGSGVVTTLWTQTGPAANRLVGCHEFSLSRNHAFHYVYNNGPVNIGAAGAAGAATAYVTTLRASLRAEYSLFAQPPAKGIAPEFGRFGFDTQWALPQAGAFQASVRYFTATSTDDETSSYLAVVNPEECGVIPAMPMLTPCCAADELHPTIAPGDTILIDPLPGGSIMNNQYYVQQCIPPNDPVYGAKGFLIVPSGQQNDPNAIPVPVFCQPMIPATPTLAPAAFPAPGPGPGPGGPGPGGPGGGPGGNPGGGGGGGGSPAPGAPHGEPTRGAPHIFIGGQNLPGVILQEFYPADPGTPLSGIRPPGSGTYPTPIPYPDPAAPGSLRSGPLGTVSSASYWGPGEAVDYRVVRLDTIWRDPDLSQIVSSVTMGEGLPYGAAFDVVLTSRANELNTVRLPSVIRLAPPQPKWMGMRLYRRNDDLSYTEINTASQAVMESQEIYIVANGLGLPLPITPADSASAAVTLWPGYPFAPDDYDFLDRKYLFVDLNSGAVSTDVTIGDMTVYRGTYTGDPASIVSGDPDQYYGQTVLARVTLENGAVGKNIAFRAYEDVAPDLPVADANLPAITHAPPYIDDVTFLVAPTTGIDIFYNVTGRNFDSNAVVTWSSNATAVLAPTSITDTSLTGGAVNFSSGTVVTMTVTNPDSGLTATYDFIIDNADAPAITSVSPDPIQEGTLSQAFTVTGSNFNEGAILTVSPASGNPRNIVYNYANDTIQVTYDVQSINVGGSSIAFTVTNSNGQADTYGVSVSAAPTPCLNELRFYETQADGVADLTGTNQAPDGKEPDFQGVMKLVGTSFQGSGTVTVNVSQYVILGTPSFVSPTAIYVPYYTVAGTPVNTAVTVTYTNPTGDSTQLAWSVEEHTPEITTWNVTNPREGAGYSGAPAGSAQVLIYGQFLTGVTSVTTDNGAVATLSGLSVTNDNLITINNLQIAGDTDGTEVTITVAKASGKSDSFTFTIQPYIEPQVSGVVLTDLGISQVVSPPVLNPGDSGFQLEIYGQYLDSPNFDIVGPLDGSITVLVHTSTLIRLTLPAIDNPVTGDPTLYGSWDLAGQASGDDDFQLALFEVVAAPGDPTDITDVTTSTFYTNSAAAILDIEGTSLGASVVGSVRLTPVNVGRIPIIYEPVGALKPIQVSIASQTSSRIVCNCVIGSMLPGRVFTVELLNLVGTAISVSTFQVTVDEYPETARFDGSVSTDAGVLPTLDVTAGASNSVVLTLVRATGQEKIEVFGGTNVTTSLGASIFEKSVEFNVSTSPGTEGEIRLLGGNGEYLDAYRFTVT